MSEKLSGKEFEKKYSLKLELGEGGAILNAAKLFSKYNLDDDVANFEKLRKVVKGSFFQRLVDKAIESVNKIKKLKMMIMEIILNAACNTCQHKDPCGSTCFLGHDLYPEKCEDYFNISFLLGLG